MRPSRMPAGSEAKIEANPEGKIEPESEAASPGRSRSPPGFDRRFEDAPRERRRDRVADLLKLPAARPLPRVISREPLEHRGLRDGDVHRALAAARRIRLRGVALVAGRAIRESQATVVAGAGAPSSDGLARGSSARAARGRADIPGGAGGCGTSTTPTRYRACAPVPATGGSGRGGDARRWSGCWCARPRRRRSRAPAPCSPTAVARAHTAGSHGGERRRSDAVAAGSSTGPSSEASRNARRRVCGTP